MAAFLNLLSKKMFGEDLKHLNDLTLVEQENPTAKATLKYIGRDDYAFNFVHMVFGTLRNLEKGMFTEEEAFNRIRDYFREKTPSPT
ncbi:hypothetical protein V3C99_015916 [Haemonchus contortus]